MSVNSYEDLLEHVGHEVHAVSYGNDLPPGGDQRPLNVAIECESCGTILVDFDRPDMVAGDGDFDIFEQPEGWDGSQPLT